MEQRKPFSEVVAEKLIEQLKAGTAPLQKPWQPGAPNTFLPMNPITGKRYKGINTIHLMSQGRSDPRWMTYKQASGVGAQVRKGEQGTPIQYWKFSEERDKLDGNGKPVLDPQGKRVTEMVMLERPRVFFATVFNGEQINGLPPLQQTMAEQKWEAIERAEHILKASGARITHAPGDRAFYRPSTDSITMPERSQFETADRYYATALHELGHWTGHPSRLDRDLRHPFGSEGYAKEELRAEIASMILGDELGIGHDPGQHAAYVGSWIKALENDPLEIFRASAEAEKIQKYVLAFEQKQIQEQEQEQTNTQAQVAGERQQEVSMQQTNQQHRQAESAQDKPERTYINVPYREKNEVKALGARWDRQEQSWYIPSGVDAALFVKWAQPLTQEAASAQSQRAVQQRVYLAVPYGERGAAKAVGAQWDKAAKSWYVGPGADMDKLQRWLPENVQGQQSPAMTPREEFAEALKSLGCVVSGDHPVMDGKKHRVGVEGDKKGEQAGFYVGHLDGHPAGYIKNNRTGIDMKWKSKGYSLDPQEKAKLQAEAAEKLAARAAEQERLHEATAQRVSRQTESLLPVSAPTPYMQAKGIQPHFGVLTDAEGKKTYIPATDADGKQWTMQYIQEDGTKRFAKDSRKEGCFHAVGGIEAVAAASALVIAEGYATAATLAETLGHGTVAAFDSGNLLAVAKALHEKFPDKPVVIAGDDDRHLVVTQGVNPGRNKAEAAAKAVGGKAIFPIFAPGENAHSVDLPPIMPRAFREHERAQQRLDAAEAGKVQITDKEAADLNRALLSSEQLGALAKMKAHTDFNDLATRSMLGRDGVARQVQAAIIQVCQAAKRKAEQKHRRGMKVG